MGEIKERSDLGYLIERSFSDLSTQPTEEKEVSSEEPEGPFTKSSSAYDRGTNVDSKKNEYGGQHTENTK